MMVKILMTMIIILIVMSPVLYGQNEVCILDTVKDGDMVKVNALLLARMRIIPTSCPQDSKYSLLLIYDDTHIYWEYLTSQSMRDYFLQQDYNLSVEESMLPLKRDKVFLEFKKLIREGIPDTKEIVCLECPKYDITAEFEGQLRVLPFPKDSTSAYIRAEGIGLIYSTVRYVLFLTSVISIEAEELGWLESPLEEYNEDGIVITSNTGPTGKIIKINSQTEAEEQKSIKPE